MNKRKSILSDIEKNYADTKSISKTVDITSLENGINPHTIYKDVFKKVNNDTPNDFPTEKISIGDIVYTGNNPNKQYEVITINNKNNIVIKNLSTNEVIETNENNIKKIMENIDMAKKKINETQYSVSINGLETTDANALSQMMSAAAQADSGNADVGGVDMTSTPELPTPEMGAMDPAVNEPITSVESIPPAEDSVETFDEEPSFEDSDIEGMDDELPTDVENPLDNPEPEMDSFEDDFEPVVDDIEFDEEITPTEDELEMDIEEPVENDLGINESDDFEEISESKESNAKLYSDDKLARYEDTFGENTFYVADVNDEYVQGGFESENEAQEWIYKYCNDNALNPDDYVVYEETESEDDYEDYGRPNWEDSDICPNCGEYNENGLDSECPNCGYNPNEDDDEEINEDILLPKATEDETFVAKKKLENDKEDEDEESERISESMDALIKSILESADAKSEQEIYAEEISEADEGEDDIDMEAFLNKFKEEYDFLYKNHDRVAGYSEALDYFDEWVKKPESKEFMKKFIELRGDFISSDREAAAFAFALESFGLLESYNKNEEKISEADEGENEEFDDDAELEEVRQMFITGDFTDDEIVEELVNRGFPEDFARDRIEEWASDDIDFDSDIDECLKNAGVKPLKESIVKPTIVTDESSFANKPNKALKPEDKKTVKKKTVDTATFGKDASEGFKEPLNCIKCEAVSPKDKIKAIYETAKTRYANADKSQWNALDRRYIRKLIESGCGYTRASKIILEAKKKK